MLKSIIYKEYIKTYKVFFAFIVIIGISLFSTFVTAKNSFEYNEATNAILSVTMMGIFNFNYLNYILPIFAIILGVAQFYPEIANARVRLYLHLPMTTFKLITIFIFIGFIALVLIFCIITFFYYIILNSYYPQEVFEAIFTKLYPIFLNSLLCYVTTILVFLEPRNKRKVLYIVVSYFTLNYYNEFTSEYFTSEFLNYVIWAIIGMYILMIYDVFDSYTKGYIK